VLDPSCAQHEEALAGQALAVNPMEGVVGGRDAALEARLVQLAASAPPAATGADVERDPRRAQAAAEVATADVAHGYATRLLQLLRDESQLLQASEDAYTAATAFVEHRRQMGGVNTILRTGRELRSSQRS
jgi:hypothetical protein